MLKNSAAFFLSVVFPRTIEKKSNCSTADKASDTACSVTDVGG